MLICVYIFQVESNVQDYPDIRPKIAVQSVSTHTICRVFTKRIRPVGDNAVTASYSVMNYCFRGTHCQKSQRLQVSHSEHLLPGKTGDWMSQLVR